MKVSLVSSLHLSHGDMSPDHQPGDPCPMLDYVPLGLLSLKASADAAGADDDIRVIELNSLINAQKIPNDPSFYDHLVDAFAEPDDDLIGLMTDQDSLHHTVLLAERVKQRYPEATICLGGPAATPLSSLLLDTFESIDYIVRGEGELTLVELLACLRERRSPEALPGLTWRSSAGAVVNPERPVENDLDRLPIPAFDAFDMAAGAPLYLDVGRGCPFTCSFCSTAPFWKQKYRMKSIERIVEEMKLIRDRYGRNHMNFSHDIFTCDRPWVLDFCQHLIDHPIGVTWSCSTRTDISRHDMLPKMAEAGCVEIFYGIESGSPEMQVTIDKKLDLDWSLDIVKATTAAGIRPVTAFIAGYPQETMQTFRDTINRFFQFLESGGFRAHVFTLSPSHESPIFRQYDSGCFDRKAEYYGLPLTGAASEACESMKDEHPELFSSCFRYKTEGVPTALIDGTEEVSATLVVLKSLWPRILPHYESPFDFYCRWIEWIERYNDEHRPGGFFRHQATPENLLMFVQAELDRVEASDEVLRDLLRYEQLKLRARFLPVGPDVRQDSAVELHLDSEVQRRCEFVAEELSRDIKAFLTPSQEEGNGQGDGEGKEPGDSEWVVVTQEDSELSRLRRWVVVSRAEGSSLNTFHLSDRAKRILDETAEPRRARDVLEQVFGSEPYDELGLDLLQNLAQAGFLVARHESSVEA